MPAIPNLVVRGRRLQEAIDVNPAFTDRAVVDVPRGGPDLGFAPPPVPPQLRPQPIPEIVVRGTTTRPFVGVGVSPVISAAGLFAVVGGYLAANILREVSQQRLDEAGELALRPVPRGPDSPLQTIPTIPDTVITVTARRQVFPQSFLQPIPQPQPLITPDFDPSILVPIVPRVMPTPTAPDRQIVTAPTIPQPQRSPANVPTRFFPPSVPVPLPLRITPDISPKRRTETSPQTTPRPATQPATSPFPGVSPSVSPAVRRQVATDPLTSLKRRLAQSLRRQTQFAARAQAVPLAAGGQCPPCPPCRKDQEQEEMREACYKKLVKEGLFPSFDTSYNWVEIDCITGREL